MLRALFIASFVLFCLSAAQDCYAPLASTNYKPFGLQQRQMPSCCWYNESTCCVEPFTSNPNTALMQLLSKEIDEVATVLSPSCYFQYANMACLLCSPNSASFVNETVYPATISVCETLCNQFFNSCNSDDFAILFGPSVEPNNGFAFCQLLFNDDLDDQDSTVHVVVSNSTSNGACFSGVTNIASISNAQGVCITATNGTKPIVPNDACLPSTQPLLLLFLFALFALLL